MVTINITASTEGKLEMADMLNANAGLIRTELALVLHTRHTPSPIFKPDLMRESQEAIGTILAEAHPADEKKQKKS